MQNYFMLFLNMLQLNGWDAISHQRLGTRYVLPAVKHTLNAVRSEAWAVGHFCALLLSQWKRDINMSSFNGNDGEVWLGHLSRCPPSGSYPPQKDPGSK